MPEEKVKASVPADQKVTVKNIDKAKIIHTSMGKIEPGKVGECTMAECRGYSKYLKLQSAKAAEK